jgi:hypothetical protein
LRIGAARTDNGGEMPPPSRGSRRSNAGLSSEDELREQEVLRANRELAAYFRGRRTEREARAALKIIKAFIRDRERTDPAKRRPLPGAKPAEHVPESAPTRKRGPRRKRPQVPEVRIPEAPAAEEPSPGD